MTTRRSGRGATWTACQFATFLHARIPRVECPTHGVKQVSVPWAAPRSRFTLLFERFAIDVLLEADVSGAAKVLRITWDEAHHLMKRAVERGMARKPRRVPEKLGIDEKAVAKGHKYMTLVCDLDSGTVEHIADDRRKESLMSYFGPMHLHEVGGIEAVAMDMWEPFYQTVIACVPDAVDKIVFDRFHVAQHMNEAVDQVRRAETKELRSDGDEVLKGTRYLWLYGRENVPETRTADFEALRALNLKTGRAWAIKEQLRDLWNCDDREDAALHFRRWYFWPLTRGSARSSRSRRWSNATSTISSPTSSTESPTRPPKESTPPFRPSRNARMDFAIARTSRRQSTSAAVGWNFIRDHPRRTRMDRPSFRALC